MERGRGATRELAIASARRGDAEDLEHHLSICFDMGALDVAAMRADPSLRGVLTNSAFKELAGHLKTWCFERTRLEALCFDEIAPNTSLCEMTLAWADEDHEAVAGAFGRLVDAAAHQAVAASRTRIEQARSTLKFYEEKLKSPFLLDDRLIGGGEDRFVEDGDVCFFGAIHRFFREIAPYLDDVRFLMSPLGLGDRRGVDRRLSLPPLSPSP